MSEGSDQLENVAHVLCPHPVVIADVLIWCAVLSCDDEWERYGAGNNGEPHARLL